MKNALIGYTGFVGSTLLTQTEFEDLFNSKNIQDISGKAYNTLVCAGAPAVKWKANQDPHGDLENLQLLMNRLADVKAERVILISTVDVYQKPKGVDERTSINPEITDPYGKHRYYLEEFVAKQFENVHIVRLPGLFGKGLKKNFIYDMMHENCLHLTHYKSRFQFYDLSNLWSDIQKVVAHDLRLVNISTEPVSAEEIAVEVFQRQFNNETEKQPVDYDMKSMYSSLLGGENGYLYSKAEVMNQIKEFVMKERNVLS